MEPFRTDAEWTAIMTLLRQGLPIETIVKILNMNRTSWRSSARNNALMAAIAARLSTSPGSRRGWMNPNAQNLQYITSRSGATNTQALHVMNTVALYAMLRGMKLPSLPDLEDEDPSALPLWFNILRGRYRRGTSH